MRNPPFGLLVSRTAVLALWVALSIAGCRPPPADGTSPSPQPDPPVPALQPYEDPRFEPIAQGSAQCGPTSLYMIFNFYGHHGVYQDASCRKTVDLGEHPTSITAKTAFAKWVNGGMLGGTSWSQLKYAMKDLKKDCARFYAVELADQTTGYPGAAGEAERQSRLTAIHASYLTRGRPVVIHIRRDPPNVGHYLVLTGFDLEKGEVHFADPNGGSPGKVSVDDFLGTPWYRSPSNPADSYLGRWDGEWMGFYPASPDQVAKHDSPRDRVLDRHGILRALIVNADEHGMSAGFNQGIAEAFGSGLVTSSSLIAPAPSIGEALDYAAAAGQPRFGVHLALTRPDYARYAPLSEASSVPSLVNQEGDFPVGLGIALLRAKEAEVRIEIRRQLEAVQQRGIAITHLDCHEGWCHAGVLGLERAYLDLAQEFQLPVRWAQGPNSAALQARGLLTPDRILIPPTTQKPNDYEERKLLVLAQLAGIGRGEIVELVFHPHAGQCPEGSEFACLDHQLLKDADIAQALRDPGLTRVSYSLLQEILAESH